MTLRILVTLGVLIYGLVVPILEINSTHVFNPEWPPHARLHEVWQLVTNTAIGVFCLWHAWGKDNVRLPSALALFITGGFLVAYAIQSRYGGSMVLSDGTEKTIMGLNLGVVAFGVVAIFSVATIILDSHQRSKAHQRVYGS
ncbi:hypothetical protein D3879_18945 [Pseudomonas cavernicola]|uniref:Uncharacterized protein n=1 Tax=Pseudomonas cavernicola TaxID=2320866 RepID=A0A418XC70_9PSED|nr:hypothetical protein [Pseudomonas cavernicola]RJG10111.1 hypothetical protein D3879_18945 [Pseudomonas cavernicola]